MRPFFRGSSLRIISSDGKPRTYKSFTGTLSAALFISAEARDSLALHNGCFKSPVENLWKTEPRNLEGPSRLLPAATGAM